MSSSGSVYKGSIAIVGGGISGLTLAIALIKRGFNVTVYEQARHFGEIGAGVAFHPAAIESMKVCDNSVYEAYLAVASHNLDAEKRDHYFDFMDGMQPTPSTGKDSVFIFQNAIGTNGVHRAHLLDELIKNVPESVTHFKKHLDTLEGPSSEGKYTLKFSDGTDAVHDAVIGTDGIKSSVRGWLVGKDHPSAKPVYTHKYAYRGLIPMERATKALGSSLAANGTFYIGRGGHMLTFPVNKGATMNVVGFINDKNDWPDYTHLTRPSTKEQVKADFAAFGPTVHNIIDMLEPELDCWAIFDTGDHPLQRYNRGKVLVLGDAGHATSPHHGSGAGTCIEDAAVLAELLADPAVTDKGERGIEDAFDAYSAERLGRTQRLVQSSRRAGELSDANTELGYDIKAIGRELEWRYRYFWEGDVQQYIRDAKGFYKTFAAQ